MGGCPGPVVAISEQYDNLPTNIKEFITKYIPPFESSHITKKTMKGIYEIKLSNGYELDFTYAGQWLKIDAPEGKYLDKKLLKKTLHHDINKYLDKHKISHLVEEIEYKYDKGYQLDACNTDYKFASDGRFYGKDD